MTFAGRLDADATEQDRQPGFGEMKPSERSVHKVAASGSARNRAVAGG
jgi:hypothetical protein